MLRSTVLGFTLSVVLGCGIASADDFVYGRHFPNGDAAVGYIYGPDGTWRDTTGLQYIWNFYPQYGTGAHPYDKASLVGYSNGVNLTTCADANNHLLFDFQHVGDIGAAGGSAFFEHNGRGVGGAPVAQPFTNFWFDDNWLARFMSEAYGRTPPNGLSDYSDFTRWRILSGDSNWTPYFARAFDQLALDGLYYLTTGQVYQALDNWHAIEQQSGANYDAANQQFVYPAINENYHAALALVLVEQLLASTSGAVSGSREELVQHSVALRSFLLDHQESDGTNLLGWRSGANDVTSLINTESTAASVIALGAGARLVFEPGTAPMQQNPSGYFARPYHALSAVTGLSQPGYMTYGPYRQLDPGTYTVDFTLRAPGASGIVASLDVNDAVNGILASRSVASTDLATGDQWARVSLTFTVSNPTNAIELRTFWQGGSNLDVSSIRVR